jgi:hypothetical protein
MGVRLLAGPWTPVRVTRIAILALCLLLGVDLSLRGRERALESELWTGRLKNAAGPSIADTTRWAMLDADPRQRERAIVVVGSSISFGPNLAPDEPIAARLARALAERGAPRPVVNLAQPGGSQRTPIPVAAAAGTHPIAVLAVELLVPGYAERPVLPGPAFGADEVALIEAGTPDQRRLIAAAGLAPSSADVFEARITSVIRSTWRRYRLRGSLWWDREFTPNYLVWSLRRAIATAGFLPKRFHGQTTNVGQLPWRKAYTGGQKPSASQRLAVTSDRISEPDYAVLLLTRDLAAAAGVRLVFFEVPLNLPFQREFALTDEAGLQHLAALREGLLARMRSDGMEVVEAPAVPDDGFLDRAHLTPLGTTLVGDHLAAALDDRG